MFDIYDSEYCKPDKTYYGMYMTIQRQNPVGVDPSKWKPMLIPKIFKSFEDAKKSLYGTLSNKGLYVSNIQQDEKDPNTFYCMDILNGVMFFHIHEVYYYDEPNYYL